MESIGEGATPLMYACQQANEKECLDLLSKKPKSVWDRDRTLKTSLHYCAETTDTRCAQAIITVAPPLINTRDEDGFSPLHLAVIAGNKPLIQLLLSRGADVNALDQEKHSVVHWATVCGELEALEMVLGAGAHVSTPDMHGGYPLHYAAQMCGPGADLHGDERAGLAVLRTLLASGADVNERDRDGRQPILWAASADAQSRDPGARFRSSGSAEAILALVKAGAQVEAADKDGLTALHCAASRGHTDCLETLVALCGAHVDTIDANGCTALFYAVTLGHADATQLLINLGAEPNRQDRKGRTPAHCGAAKGQLETLRLLLAGGANLWLRNVKGDLPLHEAVASGRRELVLWLLNQRPEAVNVANNDGKCPIHVAAIKNNVEMIKVLLDGRSLVNPVMRSSKGGLLTPLDAALLRGHRSCAKFLQLHGAVPRTKLTNVNAALRGTMSSEIMSKDHLMSKVPGQGSSALSMNPRFSDDTLAQVQLGHYEGAIRHIERIYIPPSQHGRCYDDESSEEDSHCRRRRRKRRSERRKKEIDYQEPSSKNISVSSKSFSHRKSANCSKDIDDMSNNEQRERTRNNSSSESESVLDAKQDNNSTEEHCSVVVNVDSSEKIKDLQIKKEVISNDREAIEKTPQLYNETENEIKPIDQPEAFTNDPPTTLLPETKVLEDLGSSHCEVQKRNQSIEQFDSSLEENESTQPLTVNVKAEVYQQTDPNFDLLPEPISPSATSKLLSEPPGEEAMFPDAQLTMENKEGDETALRNDCMLQEIPIVNDSATAIHDTTSMGVSLQDEENVFGSIAESETAALKVEENNWPVGRRSLSPADGSEGLDGEEESFYSRTTYRERRQSLGFGESCKKDSSPHTTRRKSDSGFSKTTHRNYFPPEGAGKDGHELTLPPGVEEPLRSNSIGEDSGGSSALLDSGIEPSPRRGRLSPSTSPSRRIPRLCRKSRADALHAPVSVTRTVQNTIRKYHLERKIFYQLLELKRLQIRAGRANEQVLVKRLVDEYQRAGQLAGLSQYAGTFSFRQFERFLYAQLHSLQARDNLIIPMLKPTDDIDTLSAILKRTRAELQDKSMDNAISCTQSTHRCPHAAHAYTGIPCAAYITKLNHHTMPKEVKQGFLPRIDPNMGGGKICGKSSERPVTLELIHGRDKQVISLPTERLDSSKRYYVTFTIKGSTTPPKTKSPPSAIAMSHQHAKTV